MKINQWADNKIQAWQLSRSPKGNSIQLSQKNTYIFPTRYGFMLLATILLMGIGATNYQNNLVFVATFTSIAIGLIAIILTFNNLVSLRITIHSPAAVFCDQVAKVPVSITSDRNHYAISLGFKGQGIQTIDVEPIAENRVELSLHCLKRGVLDVPKVRCQSIYPFGFLQAWTWLFFDTQCIVYPRPIDPESLEQVDISHGEEYSDKHKVGNEEFYGLRAYRQGDLMSRIHWKSYAREKGLQTKEFVDYLSDPDTFDYHQFAGVDRETRLSFLCFQLLKANEDGKYFGLKLPGQSIPADAGEEHLQKCLTALARFTG